MQVLTQILALAVVGVLALSASEEAFAARKKTQVKRTYTPEIARGADGTPIIMRGYRRPPAVSIMTDEPGAGRVTDQPSRKAERRRGYRRGSSGAYIPPPLPSPSSSSLPAPALVQPAPQVYRPPPITTFSDKVNNAIHDFPLQRGIGNNPNDLQSFIRQRANQP
jgi:hypothetical protein